MFKILFAFVLGMIATIATIIAAVIGVSVGDDLSTPADKKTDTPSSL